MIGGENRHPYDLPDDSLQQRLAEVDIAGLLVESHRLLRDALASHSARGTRRDGVVRLSPDEHWGDDLQQLLDSVQNEVVAAISKPLRTQRLYSQGLDSVQALHTTGKDVRILYTAEYAATRSHWSVEESSWLGRQIRVANRDFYNTIVVDGRIAVIWGHPDRQRPFGMIVTDPVLLQEIHRSVTSAWESAPGISTHLNILQRTHRTRAIAILETLSSGLKDEVAARRLAISLRTYRRDVADLMNLLGVSTRFEMGARVAELGLLPREPNQ